MSNLKKILLISPLDHEYTSLTVKEPENDHLGEKFYDILIKTCFDNGYIMKFYTNSHKENYDYNVICYPKS